MSSRLVLLVSAIAALSACKSGTGGSAVKEADGVDVPRQPIALICTDKFNEGEDQHPVEMTLTFADPLAAPAPIEWHRKSTDIYSGNVTESTESMFAVRDQSYPRVEKTPNGKINTLASRDGRTPVGNPPTLYYAMRFEISNYFAGKPAIVAEMHYAGDTWVPLGNFSCQKP